LPFLADEYILGSIGLTQVVIGIDLEYHGKGARVRVWRPNKTKKNGETIFTAEEIFKGTFRDADGNLVHGGQNLRIWLKDFGNELDCPGIQKVQGTITISFAQLYELVQESEALDQTRKRRRGQMRFSKVEAGRRGTSERQSTRHQRNSQPQTRKCSRQPRKKSRSISVTRTEIISKIKMVSWGQVAKIELVELINLKQST